MAELRQMAWRQVLRHLASWPHARLAKEACISPHGPSAACHDSAPATWPTNSGMASSGNVVVSSTLEGDQQATPACPPCSTDARRQQKEGELRSVLLRPQPGSRADIEQQREQPGRRRTSWRRSRGPKPGVRRVAWPGSVIANPASKRLKADAMDSPGARPTSPRIASEQVGRPRSPTGTSCVAPSSAASRIETRCGADEVEEPTPRREFLLLLELAADGAQLLAQFDPETDRVVPQDFPPDRPLHHLRAERRRSEQRIERRGRNELHEAFIEAAMLDTPALAFDVAVAHMDSARPARSSASCLVGGRLGSDNPGGEASLRSRKPMANRRSSSGCRTS